MEVETVSSSGPERSGQGMEGDITHHPPLAASGRAQGAAEGWQTYSEVPNLLHMGCPMCLGVGAGGALPSTAHLQLLVCAGGSRAPEQRSAGVGVAQLPRLPKAGVTWGDGGSGRDELWVQSRSSQHQTFMVPLLFQLACGGKSPRRGFPPLGYLGPQGGRAHNGAGGSLLLACSGDRGAVLCPVPVGTHPAGPSAVTVGSRWWHPRWDLQVPQAAGAPLVSAFRTAGEQVQT